MQLRIVYTFFDLPPPPCCGDSGRDRPVFAPQPRTSLVWSSLSLSLCTVHSGWCRWSVCGRRCVSGPLRTARWRQATIPTRHTLGEPGATPATRVPSSVARVLTYLLTSALRPSFVRPVCRRAIAGGRPPWRVTRGAPSPVPDASRQASAQPAAVRPKCATINHTPQIKHHSINQIVRTHQTLLAATHE